MARPRVVRSKDGGEVTLKNVSPEVADKVKALLDGATLEEAAAEEELEVEAPPINSKNPTTSHTALGTFQDASKRWCVAVIKYDPASGYAKVETTVPAGMEKADSSDRFRVLAVENNIVG